MLLRSDGLIVGEVSAKTDDGVTFATTTGLATTNGDMLVQAGGSLTLNEQVSAGSADVRLAAAGAITQSADGIITADELGVRQTSAAAGTHITLGDANDVNTLAAFNASATVPCTCVQRMSGSSAISSAMPPRSTTSSSTMETSITLPH